MTRLKDSTVRKVNDGLAKSLKKMGAERVDETVSKIAAEAAPAAERRMAMQESGPPPVHRKPEDFLEDGEKLATHVDVPTELMDGAEREAIELVSGGRSQGRRLVGRPIRDTPFSRIAFESLRERREARESREGQP